MRYKKLGKTGIDVSAIGIGTWQMGIVFTYNLVENHSKSANFVSVLKRNLNRTVSVAKLFHGTNQDVKWLGNHTPD